MLFLASERAHCPTKKQINLDYILQLGHEPEISAKVSVIGKYLGANIEALSSGALAAGAAASHPAGAASLRFVAECEVAVHNIMKESRKPPSTVQSRGV